MIKTRNQDTNDEFRTTNFDSIKNPENPSSKFQVQSSLVWLLFLIAIAIRSALLFFRPVSELVPLEILIWFPVLILAAMRAFRGLFTKLYSLDVDTSRLLAVKGALAGFAGSIAAVLLGLWSASAGGLALALGELPIYLLTVGFFPRVTGPEPMLRGFALGLGIYAAIYAYRQKHDLVHAIIHALLGWLSASVIFLLPSVFMVLTTVFTNIRAPLSSAVMAESFSSLSLNSYWINQQLARWFTGTSAQLGNAFILYTTAWIMVLFASSIFWSMRHRLRSRLMSLDMLSLLAAILVGISAGWSRMPWSMLDIPAWFLLAVIYLSVLLLDASNENRPWLIFVIIISSAILGWPTLLAALLIVALNHLSPLKVNEPDTSYDRAQLDELRSSSARRATNPEIRIPKYEIRSSLVINSCIAISLSLLAFLFVRRGFVPSPAMYLLFWSLLPFWPALQYVRSLSNSDHQWLRTAAIWTVAGVICSLTIKSFAPLAVLMMFFAFTHIILRIRPHFSKYLPYFVIASIYVILFINILLPRLLNPRLIPIN